MGWRFRRSFKMGPIRWNLSRRGLGGSGGFPGVRVGVSADGRRYLSVGIPGTGLYYLHYFGGNKSATPTNTVPSDTSGSAPHPDPPSIPVLPPTQVPVSIGTQSTLPCAHLLTKRNGVLTGKNFDIAAHAVIGRADLSTGHVDIDLGSLQEAKLVSVQHAEVRHQMGVGWILRDLGSRNGTFVRHANEPTFHRIAHEEVLNDEDEVSFGNALFEFRTGKQ